MGASDAGEELTIRLADGRSLGYAEFGARHGVPTLAFHGVPGTRLMYRPMAQAALREGVRIIALDRPGYGLSTPKEARTPQRLAT